MKRLLLITLLFAQLRAMNRYENHTFPPSSETVFKLFVEVDVNQFETEESKIVDSLMGKLNELKPRTFGLKNYQFCFFKPSKKNLRLLQLHCEDRYGLSTTKGNHLFKYNETRDILTDHESIKRVIHEKDAQSDDFRVDFGQVD